VTVRERSPLQEKARQGCKVAFETRTKRPDTHPRTVLYFTFAGLPAAKACKHIYGLKTVLQSCLFLGKQCL
jgi:hypothetical protein